MRHYVPPAFFVDNAEYAVAIPKALPRSLARQAAPADTQMLDSGLGR
jgi:hypothetical protein